MVLIFFIMMSFSKADVTDYWSLRHAALNVDRVMESDYRKLSDVIESLMDVSRGVITPETQWTSFHAVTVSCDEVRTRYARSFDYFRDFYQTLAELRELSNQLLVAKPSKVHRYEEKIAEGLHLLSRLQVRLLYVYDLEDKWGDIEIVLQWAPRVSAGETIVALELIEARLPTEIWYAEFANSPVSYTFDQNEIRVELRQPFSVSCFRSEPVILRFRGTVRSVDGNVEVREFKLGGQIPVMR